LTCIYYILQKLVLESYKLSPGQEILHGTTNRCVIWVSCTLQRTNTFLYKIFVRLHMLRTSQAFIVRHSHIYMHLDTSSFLGTLLWAYMQSVYFLHVQLNHMKSNENTLNDCGMAVTYTERTRKGFCVCFKEHFIQRFIRLNGMIHAIKFLSCGGPNANTLEHTYTRCDVTNPL